MSDRQAPGTLYAAGRLVALLRVLLLAIALGVLTLGFGGLRGEGIGEIRAFLALLLLLVGLSAGALAVFVHRIDRPWKLAVNLVLDVLWIGLFIYGSGGVDSPAVPLLFAVVLASLLVLPGTLPFVMSSLAGLGLATNAAVYLAGYAPTFISETEGGLQAGRILAVLASQILALFLVDALGHLLSRRLREQRLLTDEILDQLGEGVIAIDRHGHVVYANAEALRLLGLPQDITTGLPVESVIVGLELAPVRGLLHRDDLPVLERFIGPEARQLVLRVTPLQDRGGKDVGRVLLVADETRLVVLEESARRAERLAGLGAMAAAIAHEIRNPLASLRGCAQELGDIAMKSGSEDADGLTRIMTGEADRLARIVEDFPSLSRMRQPAREPLDCQTFLGELGIFLNLSDRADDAPVVIEVDKDCPPLSADPDQLRQALVNLVGNARDAVRGVEAPSVLIRASEAGGEILGMPAVTLEIIDKGCGIPLDRQERVFTPFYTTKAKGTGLGLSMVQHIVREHEGVVRIESEEGKGTTVKVVMPAHSQTRTFLRALGGT